MFFLFVYRILKDLMTGEVFERFWIGLDDDKNHENNWYWIDGKKAIRSETNWNDRRAKQFKRRGLCRSSKQCV